MLNPIERMNHKGYDIFCEFKNVSGKKRFVGEISKGEKYITTFTSKSRELFIAKAIEIVEDDLKRKCPGELTVKCEENKRIKCQFKNIVNGKCQFNVAGECMNNKVLYHLIETYT